MNTGQSTMLEFTWTGAKSGDYFDHRNWKPHFGPPGSTTTGVFNSTAAHKSIFLAAGAPAQTIGGWTFDGGRYTVDVSDALTFVGSGILVNGGAAAIRVTFGGSLLLDDHSDTAGAHLRIDPGATVTYSDVGRGGHGLVNAGSIGGAGDLNFGPLQLTVGSDNLSTTFSGNIIGVSLVKIGAGAWTLSGDNTFRTLTIAGGVVDLASLTADTAQTTIFAAGGVGTLRIEAAALVAGHFAPTISGFTYGDTIDLRSLPFLHGATASYDGNFPTLSVTSGSATISIDNLHIATPKAHFAVLPDDEGGSDVVFAIVANANNELVDSTHHPQGQRAPTGGPDVIIAHGVNDTIKGLAGNDSLVGGAPGDVLIGGRGADHFIFDALHASPVRHPDVIRDFSHSEGDKIDLYGLYHAESNQPLVFIGSETFQQYYQGHPGSAGAVRDVGGHVEVSLGPHLPVNFEILVHGASTLHQGDFIL